MREFKLWITDVIYKKEVTHMENREAQPQTHKHGCCSPDSKSSAKDLVTDPVCGMQVDPLTAKGGKSKFEGHDYSFCSAGCKTKFEAHPLEYL
jgi:YHS domain-containing protein